MRTCGCLQEEGAGFIDRECDGWIFRCQQGVVNGFDDGRGGAVATGGKAIATGWRGAVHYIRLEESAFLACRRGAGDAARMGSAMLRLTKKADYGLMALKYLAEQAERGPQSAKDIAEAYHIPPQLLAKILQTLTKAGLTVSQAGTHGGYALAKPATEISAFEAIRAIDGPLFITSCITIHGSCDLVGTCTIKEPLRKVNDSIKELLSGIKISHLVEADEANGAPVAGGLVTIGL